MEYIRNATSADLPRMLQLIAQAQAHFCRKGIDQWQDGYPSEAILGADIARKVSYVIETEERVVATFMVGCEADENYASIDGAWHTSGAPYVVLHRIAVEENEKGKGLAARAVGYACTLAAASNAASVRADTHADNAAMRRMLEKNGFLLCGGIRLNSGAPRVAYERVLEV